MWGGWCVGVCQCIVMREDDESSKENVVSTRVSRDVSLERRFWGEGPCVNAQPVAFGCKRVAC